MRILIKSQDHQPKSPRSQEKSQDMYKIHILTLNIIAVDKMIWGD